MDPALYSQEAEAAGERYLTVLHAFRTLLFNSLSAPFSQRSVQALRDQANQIGATYIRAEVQLIDSALEAAAEESRKKALEDAQDGTVQDFNEVEKTLLTHSVDHLTTSIRVQLLRDVESLVQRYREFALEAHLSAAGKGVRRPFVAAGMDQEKVRFYFQDRAGRRYPSQKFVRTIWRQSLVVAGAEFYLLQAATLGAHTAQVVNPGSQWDGYELALSDANPFADSFIAVRDDIFHPNSNSTLKAVF